MTPDYAYLRERMVRDLVAARGVGDERLLAVMRRVPRHRFLPEHLHGQAYGDHALPIGSGQTLSQPYVIARMVELAQVEAEHSVLEIGTGSGYQTAILAELARRVYSLERIPELVRRAIARMRELGLQNVKIAAFDGTVGWSEVAPFDRILVSAGAPAVPEPLLAQLGDDGVLIVPEGDRSQQRLVIYRRSRGGVRRESGEAVSFVPLIGRHGWKEE